MFALGALLVACLPACLIAHVSPVPCERCLTRFTRCKGFLLWLCFCLLVFWFLLGLVARFFLCFLHAFVPSLTGAQRTDSPASKKNLKVIHLFCAHHLFHLLQRDVVVAVGLIFVVFWFAFVFVFVLFSLFLASLCFLHALGSFTDWCLVHR